MTPAAGFITPVSGLLIGAVAGVMCFWAAVWLKRRLGYDDSLDVFGVHGVGGILGTVATGILATSVVAGPAVHGWIDGNFDQVLSQVYGAGIALLWSGGLTFVILKIVNVLVGLRVTPDVEIEGLDLNLHGEIVH